MTIHQGTLTLVGREIVTLQHKDLADYEYAAAVYAIMAYPDDDKARDRFNAAACFVQIREANNRIDGWGVKKQFIRPAYLLQDHGKAEIEFERGVRIISNERLIAAKMANPKAAGSDRPIGHTSKEVITSVSMDLDGRERQGKRRGKPSEGNRGNIVKYRWMPSRPVLHLALALNEMVHRFAPASSSVAFNEIFFLREFIDPLLDVADQIAPRLDELFGISEKELIRIQRL